jgi:hypothetical protein
MIGNDFTPLGTVFLVFPFQNLFDAEIPFVLGVVKVDDTEAASPNIGHRIPRGKFFPHGNSRDDTVKVNRFTGILIRQRGGHILNGFSAIGTIRCRNWGSGDLGRGPLGAFKNDAPVNIVAGRFFLFFAFPGTGIVIPLPPSKIPPPVISASSTVVHRILLLGGSLGFHSLISGLYAGSLRIGNPHY